METGSYSCSSNLVKVSDVEAVESLLKEFNTHNQVDITDGRLKIEDPSDTLNITREGRGMEGPFLEQLSRYLEEKLVITNHFNPPTGGPYEDGWSVQPGGPIKYHV